MDFIKKFEENVKNTILKYKLFTKNDRVLVACSGGKDSTAVLYILKKLGYNTEALTIDLGIGNYSKQNLINVRNFCKEHKIKLNETSFAKEFGSSKCKIYDCIKSKGVKLNSCAVCGILRRYLLNKKARELKFNVIVTGHNLDDEAQAIMMNFLRNTMHLQSRLGPTSGVIKDKRFVPRVKPLYFCLEKDVKTYSQIKKFNVIYEKCPCIASSFRNKIRGILNEMINEDKIKRNIVNNFLNILPKIKEKYNKSKLRSCEICEEPSSGKICTTCILIETLK